MFSGVTADDDYGFTDEETNELSLQEMEQVSPEKDLETVRETSLVDL